MDQKIDCKVHAINILTLIDTDAVIADNAANENDPAEPETVDARPQRLLCSGSRGTINGEGTTDLTFKARKGDYVTIRGLSLSNNSDDAIIIYNIHQKKGSHVFRPFVPEEGTFPSMTFDPSKPDGLQFLSTAVEHLSFDAKIKHTGTAELSIQFGLYKLQRDRETQKLYGYFEFDVTITVEQD